MQKSNNLLNATHIEKIAIMKELMINHKMVILSKIATPKSWIITALPRSSDFGKENKERKDF